MYHGNQSTKRTESQPEKRCFFRRTGRDSGQSELECKAEGISGRTFGIGHRSGSGLFELKDGNKGAVQALGNAFGSLNRPPFIALDGDDRTGAAAAGENLRINGNEIKNIQRILVYTFIYEGVANWKQADATVTLKYPGAEDLVVKMDTFNSSNKMCGLVLLENVNDETFSVEKIVQFYQGHEDLDRAFGWGLRWRAGRK